MNLTHRRWRLSEILSKGIPSVIYGLALSLDGTLLASASFETIKLWAIELRQFLASFHVQDERWISDLILSPDACQLAYSANHKIFICTIPPNILSSISTGCTGQSLHLLHISNR